MQGTAGGRALAGRMPGADRRTHGGAERRHVQPSDRPAAAQAGAGRTGHPFFGTQAGAVPHTGTECRAHLGAEFPGNVATDLLTGRSSRPG